MSFFRRAHERNHGPQNHTQKQTNLHFGYQFSKSVVLPIRSTGHCVYSVASFLNKLDRRLARMLRVWRTHHPYAAFFYFLLTRFLIAHATNTKTQMKKNEPSGLLFTSSLLAKSGLAVTPLCRHHATRCKHRYRALRDQLRLCRDREHLPRNAAESLSVVPQSGAGSCSVRS